MGRGSRYERGQTRGPVKGRVLVQIEKEFQLRWNEIGLVWD